MGVQSLKILVNPASIISSVVGGKEYQAFQMGEPMNPLTTPQPMALAARAVAFISSTAQVADLVGLALDRGGAKPFRRSSYRSPTHWPARWAPSAQHCRLYFLRICHFSLT